MLVFIPLIGFDFYNKTFVIQSAMFSSVKGKLTHTWTFSRAHIDLNRAAPKPRVVGSIPSTGTNGEVFIEKTLKQRSYLIGYNSNSYLIWESLVCHFWLAVLRFHFLGFKFIDCGLGFGCFQRLPMH